MKRFFLLTIGLILATLFINPAIVSGEELIIATYTNLDLQITPSSVSVCPCVPITPQHVKITVRNLGAEPVIPSFELIGVPNGWTGQIQGYLDKSLAPGEEGEVSLLLINPPGCNVAPGVYSVTVRATGLTAGDYDEEELQIEIMQCYGVELAVSEDYKETCIESGEEVVYPLMIKNLGKNSDVFDLATNVAWARFSESSVNIGPGKTCEFISEPNS